MRRAMIWWIAGAVILISAAVLFFSWRASHRVLQGALPTSAPTEAPASTPPPISNPVPDTPTSQPLPSLDASDTPVHNALGMLLGMKSVDALFKSDMLVRHIVVTVDNMPRKRVAVELRPTKPLAGAFLAAGDDEHSTIDPANYQRYTPYVQALQMLDMKTLSSLYFQYYPLFQRAYQDLGYPNGYFNDRLVQAIDDLLAAPDPSGEIALSRPNVMYLYSDPQFEDLSAGQKAILRMGPANAAMVKVKLRELRSAIANRPDTASVAPSSAPAVTSH